MSASGLVHNDTFIFDGTNNYPLWRNRMLCNIRTMCLNIERFLDVGFSPPMDPQNLSLEDEKNLHLDRHVSYEFQHSLCEDIRIFLILSDCERSHEKWAKLEETYGGSISHEVDCLSKELSSPSHHEELQVASPSGRDDSSIPSTSPTCGKTRGNDMVSGDENCNVDIVLTIGDPSSLSHCNVSSLDPDTFSTKNALHACVDSP